MKYFGVWSFALLILMACQPFQSALESSSGQDKWQNEQGEPVEGDLIPTLSTRLTDTSITVTVTGNVIEFVDFYLDKELSPRLNATSDPFEFTQQFAGLAAGDHEIKVVSGVKILGQVSTLIRYVPFTVKASVPSPQPDPRPVAKCDQMGNNQFFGCYYNDQELKNLVFTRMDREIKFDFGRSAPGPGVGEDNFSMRWQGNFDFGKDANYVFTATADDGVRLYINDKLVINEWAVIQGAAKPHTVTLNLKKGKHKIVLEYFEFDWGASVSLAWREGAVSEPPNPGPQDPPPAPAPNPNPNPGGKNTASYQVDNTDFMNPERGFHDDININDGGNYNSVRNKGYSVTRALARLDAFRTGPISAEYLNRLRNNLANVRKAGIKIALRFAYNYQGGGRDADIAIVEGHIRQLAPVLQEYADVIAVLHAGFVGAWGEWHSSTEGLTTRANKKRVVDALMAALPASRMIDIRSPWHRREIYDGNYVPITNPFDGSKISRIGFLNDCFLASNNDVGTFAGDQTRDRREAAEFSRYTATTGETCDINLIPERTACSNSLKELEAHHWDILNAEFYAGIINGWKSQGCFNEISRRLGYRFSLETAGVTASTTRGGTLSLDLRMRNTGFGKVYNPRPIDVVLRRKASNEVRIIRAVQDARTQLPLGGETKTLTLNINLPSDMVAGDYDVLIRMPDASSALASDVRYSIRIANQNMWEEGTGFNNLRLTTNVK